MANDRAAPWSSELARRSATRLRARARAVRLLLEILFAPLLLLPLGCPLLDMSMLVVTSFSPRESRLADIAGVNPEIHFSKEVNRRTVEEAFSITADGSPLPGRITWPDGRTLRFVPAEPLARCVAYRMQLSTEAEDTLGNDLHEPFSHTFTTKSDEGRPTVTGAVPADRARVADPLAPISITFSEPMDAASLYSAFSLSPAVSGLFALNDERTTLTFTPSDQLTWQTEYLVTVAASAADSQRNTLGADYRLRFTVGTDTTPPEILSVKSLDGAITVPPDDPNGATPNVAEGWEATSELVVSFSEPVVTASATASAQLAPPVDFTIDEAHTTATQTLTYRFPGRLAYGTLYTLSLSVGIQDTQGNPTREARIFHLLVNGPLTKPPTIAQVLFPASPGDSATNQPLVDWGELDLSNFTTGARTDTFFDLYLDLAVGAAIDPFAIVDNVSFTVTNDAVDIAPFAVQIDPASPPTWPPPSTDKNEVVARIWVHLTNNSSSGQVTLRAASTLADSRGACLERDFLLPLNEPR